ncbi:MAG: hypothetical protein K6B44_04715 [Lachnospiraceae bacterium]|nr:hypothetical protein [Lachnospiraceae bacterium]
MRVVITGDIAVRGTIKLLEENREELKKVFSNSFMRRAAAVREEELPRIEEGISFTEIGEGGITEALWELAEREKTGLRIMLDAIPVKQETIEICNQLDKDPYTLASYGTALCFVPEGKQVGGTDVGYTINDKKRLLLYGDTVRFLRVNKSEQSED